MVQFIVEHIHLSKSTLDSIAQTTTLENDHAFPHP